MRELVDEARRLGSSLLRQVQRTELAGVGLLAGFLASIVAAAVGWALARYVFEFDWTVQLWVPLAGAVAGARRAPELQRSMQNFKTALRFRLGRDLDPAALRKIADAIDRAAVARDNRGIVAVSRHLWPLPRNR